MPSFDIVSKVDLQEVRNAVNQTLSEVRQRYDFKNVKCSVELREKELALTSDDEFKLKSMVEILISKLVKRKVPQKALSFGKIDHALGGRAKLLITIQEGISKDNARLIVKDVKDLKLKVQPQIMEDQVRVQSKKIDELQSVIKHLKEKNYDFHVQFTNYR